MIALAGVIAVIMGQARSGAADGPETVEERAFRVEQRLVCPTCTNLRLDLCDIAICEDMRGVIREKLIAGESEDAIVEYFVARYGERALGAPPKRGVHLIAWALPAAAAGGASVLIVLLGVRHRRRKVLVRGVGTAATSSEERERLVAEMERYRESDLPWS